VVRVGEGAPGQIPSLVPSQPRLVEQDAHQFRDRECRVGVVELDRHLVGQSAPIVVKTAKPPYQICQRAGDEEVFLHEPKPLSHACRIVGIEDSGHRLGGELRCQRADEFAGAEHLKIKAAGRCRSPQPQRVDRLAAIADDRPVERHPEQAGRTARYRPQTAALHFE
jgi:hypothetical protein